MNNNSFLHRISGVYIAFVMTLTLVQFPLLEFSNESGDFITFHPPASDTAVEVNPPGAAEGWKFPSLALYPDGLLGQSLDSLVGPLFGPYSQAQHNFPE